MFNNALVCTDSEPGWLGLFDFSIAPNLMFYSYIPIVFLALFFGFFVFKRTKNTLSKLLLLISIMFSVWVVLEIINWTAVPAVMVAFAWQMTFFVIPMLTLLSFIFYYNFVFKKQLSFSKYLAIFTAFLPILFILPSRLNFVSFDLYNCENIDGLGWYYGYLFGLLCFILTLISGFVVFFKEKGKINRTKNVLVTLATLLFLFIFLSATTLGDLIYIYEFSLIGPIGMFLFVIFMSYLVARYRVFNIKVLTSRFLIFALVFGNFSLFFIQDINNVRIIVLITLVITIIIGSLLFRSIKIIETQRQELDTANHNQQKLLHFITHQVKSFMTKSRNIFSGIVEGDYGKVNKKVLDIAKEGFEFETSGVETIQNILHASNLKKGTVEFVKKDFDIVQLLSSIVDSMQKKAVEKGLNFVSNIPNGAIVIKGDELKLAEVIKNIIDNSIIYTQNGSIEINIKDTGNKVQLSVKDTGVGLSPEDKEKLFTEGGKGGDSLKYNVNTTGYGLFIAKQIVKEHGGNLEAKSEGRGKGSEFIVELPK